MSKKIYPDLWVCKTCGKKFPHNGHKRSFCSHACYRQSQLNGEYLSGRFKCGKKHWAYKNGEHSGRYPTKFNNYLRELVRERDNYECQKCGVPQRECNKRLDVHHIDNNRNNLSLKNLVSLCHSCHTHTHWDERKKGFNKKHIRR